MALGRSKSATGKSVAKTTVTHASGTSKKAGGTTASQHGPASVSRPFKSSSWLLQDAKARFSELVRRVKKDGPQRVTVHGREEVVVISVDEFRRLKGERTGAALIEAMQASPNRDIEIAPTRLAMPVRTLEL